MKKLTYKRVKENIDDLLKANGFEVHPGPEPNRLDCVILGFLDSINECIEPEWKGKKVALYCNMDFIGTKGPISSSTMVQKDCSMLCLEEKGKYVKIQLPDDTERHVLKESVYLCEDQ